MGFCAFGMVGDCGTKSKSTTSIDLKTVNETISNFVSSKSQKITSSGINIQDIEFVIGKTSGNCKIDASQKITSTQTTTGELSPTDMKDLRSKIKESLDASIEEQAKSKTGMFSTAPASAENVALYKNTVENKIESNLSDTQIQDISNSVFNKQTKKVTLGECTDNSNLDFRQDIVSVLVTNGIMKAVSTTVAGATTEVAQKLGVKQSSTAETEGLGDIISKFFEGLTGIWGIVAALICCVFCSLCIGLVMFLLSPAGQQATTTIANAGADKLKQMPIIPP